MHLQFILQCNSFIAKEIRKITGDIATVYLTDYWHN